MNAADTPSSQPDLLAPRHGTVGDLATGDILLHLAGIDFTPHHNPDTPPILVANLHHHPEHDLTSVITSVGEMLVHNNQPATYRPGSPDVTPNTILLISRRQTLTAKLLQLGVPITRRSPIPGDTVPAVTTQEWATAALVAVDGYLSIRTIQYLWHHHAVVDRDQTVTISDNPDRLDLEHRALAVRARALLMLPYDQDTIRDLFEAATNRPGATQPFTGILTPATR